MHEPRRLISRSTKRARRRSGFCKPTRGTGRRALESGRRSLPERADEAILIETGGGVQRMTVCEMFDDFEALKVCVG